MEFEAKITHLNSDDEFIGEEVMNFEISFDLDDEEEQIEAFFNAEFDLDS